MGERLLRGQTFTRDVQELVPPQSVSLDPLALMGGGGGDMTMTKPAEMRTRQIQTQGRAPLLNFLADFATSFGAGPQAAQHQINRRVGLLQENLDTQQREQDKKNAFLLRQIEDQTPEFRVLANGDVAFINKQALQSGDFKRAFTMIPNPSKLKPEQIQGFMDKMSEDLGLSDEESAIARMAAIESLEQGDVTPLRTVATQIVTQRNIAERQAATAQRAEERQAQRDQAAEDRAAKREANTESRFTRLLNARQGTTEDAQAWADRLASGQIASIQNVPGTTQFKTLVLKALGDRMVVSPKVRGELAELDSAEAALDIYKESLENFINAKGAGESAKAAIIMKREANAFSRVVGRALGEQRFTDEDKKDFVSVLGPDIILNTVDPSISRKQIEDVKRTMTNIRERKIRGMARTFTANPEKPKESKAKSLKFD